MCTNNSSTTCSPYRPQIQRRILVAVNLIRYLKFLSFQTHVPILPPLPRCGVEAGVSLPSAIVASAKHRSLAAIPFPVAGIKPTRAERARGINARALTAGVGESAVPLWALRELLFRVNVSSSLVVIILQRRPSLVHARLPSRARRSRYSAPLRSFMPAQRALHWPRLERE